MNTITGFSAQVIRKLKYYVYLYVDPRDGKVFYVGKGRSNRAFAHLKKRGKSKLARKLHEICADECEPQIELLAHDLPDEATAFKIEAAAIDLIGMVNLCNEQRGHESREYGRRLVGQIAGRYARRPANIREPAILIRINHLYRPDMTDAELYDATRSAWRVGPRCEDVTLAFAVFEGVIREVYEITGWLEGGSTFTHQRSGKRDLGWGDRWEFVGTIADEPTRKRYINKYVGDEFKQGAQNPIMYVNLDESKRRVPRVTSRAAEPRTQ